MCRRGPGRLNCVGCRGGAGASCWRRSSINGKVSSFCRAVNPSSVPQTHQAHPTIFETGVPKLQAPIAGDWASPDCRRLVASGVSPSSLSITGA